MNQLTTDYLPGVSVIIPSHRGGSSLQRALDSVKNQSLAPDLFEVIVVLNGQCASVDAAERLVRAYAGLKLRVFLCQTPSASKARNVGLALASHEFLTFLDDDDMLEPRFLEVAMRLASPTCIALMPIADLDDGKLSSKGTLGVRIRALSGTTSSLSSCPWALGFNACKIVWTGVAQKYRYDESLKSGEDLVFFAQFLNEDSLSFVVPTEFKDCSYVREISQGSLSRSHEGFEFNVRQRLQCIKQLQGISLVGEKLIARQALEKAQFGFIERYLRREPSESSAVLKCAVEMGVTRLPWAKIRGNRAQSLVFSYCFPPYADTSANVVAKLIRSEGKLVDVFYSDMSSVRNFDKSTAEIVSPYVVFSEEIKVSPSFANWSLICQFAQKAVASAKRRAKKNGEYDSMYSRSMWSGSHVAAALYKRDNPTIFWEAEFSDPLTQGVDGSQRIGKLSWGEVTDALLEMVQAAGLGKRSFSSHFELTELVTLIFADSVIFTNENQKLVMLAKYPAFLRTEIDKKSLIRSHISPSPELFELKKCNYSLDSGLVNIAYFGNFYVNRGIGEIIAGLESLPNEVRQFLRIHIFTGDPKRLLSQLKDEVVAQNIRVNPYVEYLDFLNLATKFDVLVVGDTQTSDSAFSVNPFLPSKYSDYRGSGVPIWGIVVEGSPLSMMPLEYRSVSGNIGSNIAVLEELVSQKINERREINFESFEGSGLGSDGFRK